MPLRKKLFVTTVLDSILPLTDKLDSNVPVTAEITLVFV